MGFLRRANATLEATSYKVYIVCNNLPLRYRPLEPPPPSLPPDCSDDDDLQSGTTRFDPLPTTPPVAVSPLVIFRSHRGEGKIRGWIAPVLLSLAGSRSEGLHMNDVSAEAVDCRSAPGKVVRSSRFSNNKARLFQLLPQNLILMRGNGLQLTCVPKESGGSVVVPCAYYIR